MIRTLPNKPNFDSWSYNCMVGLYLADKTLKRCRLWTKNDLSNLYGKSNRSSSPLISYKYYIIWYETLKYWNEKLFEFRSQVQYAKNILHYTSSTASDFYFIFLFIFYLCEWVMNCLYRNWFSEIHEKRERTHRRQIQ